MLEGLKAGSMNCIRKLAEYKPEFKSSSIILPRFLVLSWSEVILYGTTVSRPTFKFLPRLPSTTDCNLEAEINPFFLKLFLAMVFLITAE